MVSDCFLLLNALKLILNFFFKIAAFLYIAQMNSAWPQYAMGLLQFDWLINQFMLNGLYF